MKTFPINFFVCLLFLHQILSDEHSSDLSEEHSSDLSEDIHLDQQNLPQIVDKAQALVLEQQGLIQIASDDPEEHTRNFKKISEDVKVYFEAYKGCLEDIPESDYSEQRIDECVGENFNYVINDIDYEKKKIVSRVDAKIREAMIEFCYKPADLDQVMANACDLLERDTLDLLWEELNFHQLLDYNRHKYLFEYAKLDPHIFDNLLFFFKKLYHEFDELLEEVLNHRDLTVVKLKQYIDDRTRDLVLRAKDKLTNPQPLIKKSIIEVEERIQKPTFTDMSKLPRPVVQNASPNMYELNHNPYTDEYFKNGGSQIIWTGIDQPTKIRTGYRNLNQNNKRVLEEEKDKSGFL